jgi:hypothetical protein
MPASYWLELMAENGFTDIVSREYAVEMRKESRSQLGFFSTGDYLDLLWNMLKVTLGRDPFVRNLAKRSWSNPRDFYDFFGYGLFVGWKN